MARRARIPDSGIFDTEKHAAALDRAMDTIVGPRQESEKPSPGPEGVSGAGGASTGFGRRAFQTDYEQIQWNPETPYPQEAPMRSTDMERPRTIASGYDPTSNILRVTFRNGVIYEYLEVPRQTWEAFKRSPSPGRMIDDVLNQFFYRRI